MPRTRTKRSAGWSYKAGEKGANRVSVHVHRSGRLFVEYHRNGVRIRQSLRHSDRQQAKEQADLLAAELRLPDQKRIPTLGEIFSIYLCEQTPTKSLTTQRKDRATLARFLDILGKDTRVDQLTSRDAKRYAVLRKQRGDLRPRKRIKGIPSTDYYEVGSRSIAYDLKLVKAVFNWGREAGLLERNPLEGFKITDKGTPQRPVFTEAQYQAMLSVVDRFPWQMRVLLTLANETGHRLSAILSLRWTDVDTKGGYVTWRKENDKIGHEHITPMSDGARDVFELARLRTKSIGDSLVLPGVTDPSKPVPKNLARDWMQRIQPMAGLQVVKGKGYHGLRRKFASELSESPARNLMDLGGWKDYGTIVKCYQLPSNIGMRTALANRKVLEG